MDSSLFDLSSLRGQVAIVTGASRGIGAALTVELARLGVYVVAVARDSECLANIASMAQTITADLRSVEGRSRVVAETMARHRRIDLLINSAGVGYLRPLSMQPPEEIDAMISLNLAALTHLTALVLPQMRRQRAGRVVNIASTLARRGAPNAAVYAATKWAVLGFSHSLSMECAVDSGITVSTICPGTVETDFLRASPVDLDREQLLTTDEVVRSVLFALIQRPGVAVSELTLSSARSALRWNAERVRHEA